MVTRAVIMEVVARHVPPTSGVSVFLVHYRALSPGRKRKRFYYIDAKDELDAYMQAVKRLERRGYRVV